MAALIYVTLLSITFLMGWAFGELQLRSKKVASLQLYDKPNINTYQERKPLIFLNLFLIFAAVAIGFNAIGYMFTFSLGIPVWVIIVQTLVIVLVDDLWFYASHRWLHENKYLFRKIHSIHHRVRSPLALDYFYVHPFEWMIAGAGIPVAIIGLYFIFGSVSFYAVFIYSVFKTIHELDIHSGIHSYFSELKYLKWLGSAEHHGAHHSKFNGNYASSFKFWDKILKTEL